MREERRNSADRSGLSLAVIEGKVRLRGRVELENPRDREARLECLPDVRSQSVAACDAYAMLALTWAWRHVDQESTELTDVLEQRALGACDVVPEAARRELAAQHDRSAAHKRRSDRDHTADAMVHRETVVHPIILIGVQQPGKPVAPLQQAMVAEHRRLGQAGRA